MDASVLTIGTEITRGELVNTNAAWLGERLTELGLEVVEQSTVRDKLSDITRTLKHLAETTDVIVVTGGLGPTSDDITAEAVAEALEVPLTLHKPSLEAIRKMFQLRGRDMPASNRKQAELPTGSEAIPNSKGTAPGFAVRIGNAQAFCFPGVPREMKAMFENFVMPRLAPTVAKTESTQRLRCFGLAESTLADSLKELEESYEDVEFGYRVRFPEIELRFTARGTVDAGASELAHTEALRGAEARAKEAREAVRARIETYVFGDGTDSFPAAVGKRLRNQGLRLALAESCTGGLIGSLLTGIPGSSEYLVLSAVTYANAAKTKLLEVSEDLLRAHGAVSEETAIAMAEGALRLGEADFAVAVTGIAGPGGGTDDKPVGTTWIAIASKHRKSTKPGQDHGSFAKHFQFVGNRERVRTMAAYHAFQLLYSCL